MNKRTVHLFVDRLIGAVPSPRQSIVKGGISGAVLFFIAEYLSVINSNAPRIPVAWLMIVATIMVESVLFFRVVFLLYKPRRENIITIFRMNYAMRTTIASAAIQRAHESFIPFTATILVISSCGQLLLLHERSFLMQCIIPSVTIIIMIALERCAQIAIRQNRIPCTRRDHDGKVLHGNRQSLIRQYITKYALPFSRWISTFFPIALKPLIIRNCCYLFRGELLLTLVITVATPFLLLPLLIMVHNPGSPLITLLPLIAIFMMNHHFSSEFTEASRASDECHWYSFTSAQLLKSYLFTLCLPALPVLLFTCAVLFPASVSLLGLVRLLNFFVAIFATLVIGCRNCLANNDDTAPAVGFALFAIIAVGNFIPWAGGIFSIAAIGILFLLNGTTVLKKTL